MKQQSMRPQYVEFIPKTLEDGILYISKKFNTASHLCCCGCGTKIVTPVRKTEYTLTERGALVSLHPSIGNWNHPCQSHYFIRDNRVLWVGAMSQTDIRLGRSYDDAQKEAYFDNVAWPWWRKTASDIKRWLTSLFR